MGGRGCAAVTDHVRTKNMRHFVDRTTLFRRGLLRNLGSLLPYGTCDDTHTQTHTNSRSRSHSLTHSLTLTRSLFSTDPRFGAILCAATVVFAIIVIPLDMHAEVPLCGLLVLGMLRKLLVRAVVVLTAWE